MDTNTQLQEAKKAIETARTILIVTHERPSHDAIGSSLALMLGLESLGKKVTVACSDPVTVEFSDYIGANKIVTDIARKNFVISLDYVEGSIEKVSYNIEGNTFNLVIEPRPGFEPFSKDKVHFKNTGVLSDLVIAVDTIHAGGYRKLTENAGSEFAEIPLLTIDRHPNNALYGTINLVDSSQATTGEIVASLLSVLGVKLSRDIATNMLNALYHGTQNFQSSEVTGRTFELAAACTKAGARRFGDRQGSASEKAVTQDTANPAVGNEEHYQADKQDNQVGAAVNQPVSGKPPADWLAKPKIFRSSQQS